MANIGYNGGKITVTATTLPEGHKIETAPGCIIPSWIKNVSTGTTWTANVQQNQGDARSFNLSIVVTTNEDSEYDGTATIPCAWTINQAKYEVPECTFNFTYDQDVRAHNQSTNTINFNSPTDTTQSFVMTTDTGSANSGFKNRVDSHESTDLTLVGARSATVKIKENEAEKTIKMKYVFEGEKDSTQRVKLTVSFEFGDRTKTIEFSYSGQGISKEIDVSDWFVPNGVVNVDVSFVFEITGQ